MAVPVNRYQRNKILSDPASPTLFYLRQEPGSFKTVTIESIAQDIETVGALSAEDVTHTMKSFIKQLRKALVEGNRVKIEGLGYFYLTFACKGTALEKDCTVKNIIRVNLRFAVDNALRLVNDSTATTRSASNNVKFYIKGESAAAPGGDGNGDGSGSDGGNGGGGEIVDPIV